MPRPLFEPNENQGFPFATFPFRFKIFSQPRRCCFISFNNIRRPDRDSNSGYHRTPKIWMRLALRCKILFSYGEKIASFERVAFLTTELSGLYSLLIIY